MRRSAGAAGVAAAAWALLGVALLFLFAAMRLRRRGLETVQAGLAPLEWVALALLTAVFVYAEGFRALQRRWVPRLIRRVCALREEGCMHHRVLAPLYGMSLIGAPPGSTVRAWGGTLAIVGAVMLVRAFPEPWRGITDLAVASALVWGLGAILVEARRAFR
ncbi:MAG: hypothetical protein Q8N53_15005 [Longimicrobiales bacterium]|nr:hypothetical protein [Longimicrobiales bacterium]